MAEHKNPWKGLSTYTLCDSEKFAGRNKEIKQLCFLIEHNLIVTLYGKSGVGKSSILNAGVTPELNLAGYTTLHINVRDIKNNSLNITEKVIENLRKSLGIDENIALNSLWDLLHQRKLKENNIFPIIVFDQFEEIFDVPNNEQTNKFLCQIAELKHGRASQVLDSSNLFENNNFRIVLSLREDDLYKLEDLIDRNSLYLLKDNRYRLCSLSNEGLISVLSLGEKYFEDFERCKEIIIEKFSKTTDVNTRIDSATLSLLCYRLFEKTQGHITAEDILMENNPLYALYLEVIRDLSLSERNFIESKFITSSGRREIVKFSVFKKNISNYEYFLKNNDGFAIFRVTNNNNCVELVHDSISKAIYEAQKERTDNFQKTCQKISKVFNYILPTLLGILFLLWGVNYNTGISEEWTETITYIYYHGIKTTDFLYGAFALVDTTTLLFCVLVIPLLTCLLFTNYRYKRKVALMATMSNFILLVARYLLENYGTTSYCFLDTKREYVFSNFEKLIPFYVCSIVIVSFIALYTVIIKFVSSSSNRLSFKEVLPKMKPFVFSIFVVYSTLIVLIQRHYVFDSIPLIYFCVLVLIDIIVLYSYLAESYKFKNFVSLFLICLSLFWCRFYLIYREYYLWISLFILIILVYLSIRLLFKNSIFAKQKSTCFSIASIIFVCYSIGYNPFSINGIVNGKLSQPWEYIIVSKKDKNTNTADMLYYNGDIILNDLSFDACSANNSVFYFHKSWESFSDNEYYDSILRQANYPLIYDKYKKEFTIFVIPELEFIVKNKLKNKDASKNDSLQAAIFLEARRSIVNSIYQKNRIGDNKHLKKMFETLLFCQYNIYQSFIENYKNSDIKEAKEKKSLYLASKVKDIRKSLACYISTLQLYEAFCSKSTYDDDDIKQQMVALQVFTSLQILTKDVRHFSQNINSNVNFGSNSSKESLVANYHSKDWLNDEVGPAINWLYIYDIIYHPIEKKQKKWLELVLKSSEITKSLSREILDETMIVSLHMLDELRPNIDVIKSKTKTTDFAKLDSLRNQLKKAVNIELFAKNYASPIFSAKAIKNMLSLIDTQTPDYNAVFMDLSKMLIIMGSLRDIDMHSSLKDLDDAVQANYGLMYKTALQQDSVRSLYYNYIDEYNRSFDEQESSINELKKLSKVIDKK